MHTITSCGISDSTDFHTLWTLPALPLTERFGTYSASKDLAHDQELVISMPTGHVQLRRQLDPRILYTDSEYAFRTGASAKSRRDVAWFLDFLKPHIQGRRFKSLLDVGGNDGYLARQLQTQADECAVIDPICKGRNGTVEEGVRFFGSFIEELDLGKDLKAPDLLLCRHTLEHIARPRRVIEQWFSQCSEDCLYAIEVPCFDCLVESLRFDAVFHQHFQYYDIHSFKQLIWQCGGEYLAHATNHQGSCGGALIVLFRKAKSALPAPVIDLKARITRFEAAIANYKRQSTLLGEILRTIPGPRFGYGAGLMLATYAYHLGTDLSFLEGVFDDDPLKHGAGYENLPVRIIDPAKQTPPPNASYLITSLENLRPIYRRLQDFQPRRILMPPLS